MVSDIRHKPLPSSVLVLSLPEPALAAPAAAVLAPPVVTPGPGPSPVAAPKAAPLPATPAQVPAATAAPAPKPETPKPETPKPETPKPEAAKAPAPKAPETSKGSTLPPPGPASTIQTQVLPGERKPDIARNVTVDLGQRIELPFEGSGWTYLGETEGREGILYESRRYEGPGLTFVLNTGKVGDFVLRFQKEDLLRGTTNEELVAVHVNPKPLKAEPLPGATPSSLAAALPAGPGPGTSLPGPAGTAMPAATPTQVSGGSVQAPPSPTVTALPQAQASSAFALSLPDSPEGLLQAARKELLAGRVPGSLTALDRFLALYPEGMDEVFYLYGLSLEQNGDTKDIKRAYASYKRLVDTWPESQFWDQAKARMAFLERHYFAIR